MSTIEITTKIAALKELEDLIEEAKAEAYAAIEQMALDIENEANIETLLKAKGFEE